MQRSGVSIVPNVSLSLLKKKKRKNVVQPQLGLKEATNPKSHLGKKEKKTSETKGVMLSMMLPPPLFTVKAMQ